jgi:DNA-binding beta-propeller fold protein YncE
MTRLEKILMTFILIAIPIALFIYWKFTPTLLAGTRTTESSENIEKDSKEKKDKKKDKKNKKDDKEDADVSSAIAINEKWEMPTALTEISGFVYLDNNRFACIQDEQGKIFIYNTANNKIEKEIPFGDKGDYEGIAVVGQAAYVLRSDGTIFEVSNFNAAKPKVKEYDTPLTVEQDSESLCYDQKNNRLLVAVKGDDPNSKDYKGIYGFDLTSKKMAETPVLKIDLTNPLLEEEGKKKSGGEFYPSEIALHPTTGDIYILDGKDAKLLIMDAEGNDKNLFQLNTSDFPQAEGQAFSPDGELFVSNEGGDGKGTILKVSIGE